MQTLPFGLTTASKHTFNRPLLWAPSTLFPFLRTADIMPRAQITWPSSQQVPRALHTCSASPVFVCHVLQGLFQLLLDCCSEAWKNRDFKPTRSGRDEIAWSQNIFFFLSFFSLWWWQGSKEFDPAWRHHQGCFQARTAAETENAGRECPLILWNNHFFPHDCIHEYTPCLLFEELRDTMFL